MKIHIFIAICLACAIAAGLGGCASTGRIRGGSESVATPSGAGGWFQTDPLKEYLDSTGPLTSVRGEGQALVAMPGESIRLSVSFEVSPDSSRIRYRGRYGLGSGEWILRGDSLFHVHGDGMDSANLEDLRRNPDDYDPLERMLAVSLFDAYRLPLRGGIYEEWRTEDGSVDYAFDDGSVLRFSTSGRLAIALVGSPIFTTGTDLLLEGFMTPRQTSAEWEEASGRRTMEDAGAKDPYLPKKITLTRQAERFRLTLVHTSLTPVLP